MPNYATLPNIQYPPRWVAAQSFPLSRSSTGVIAVQADIEIDPYQIVHMNCPFFSGFYSPLEDAWVSSLSTVTTLAAGNAACWHPGGPTGTALGATATTIQIPFTATRKLAGYVIRITGGKGAGQERTISKNTLGSNSTFTVTTPWTTIPDNTSTYQLRTGRFYYYNSDGNFLYMELADFNVTSPLATINLPGATGGNAALCATYGGTLVTGVPTASTSTTLTDSTKNWTASQFVNFQVRITSGTGAGQVRTISASTATSITVSAAWTTQPDGSSVYVIEGNEDNIYLMVNNTLYMRWYNISTNTWFTNTTFLRSYVSGFASLHHINRETHPLWVQESALLNGRYIYSFAGAGNQLERYDLTTSSWSTIASSLLFPDNLSTGSSTCYAHGYLYFRRGVGQLYRLSPSRCMSDPLPEWPAVNSGTIYGPYFGPTAGYHNVLFAAKMPVGSGYSRRIYGWADNTFNGYYLQENF